MTSQQTAAELWELARRIAELHGQLSCVTEISHWHSPAAMRYREQVHELLSSLSVQREVVVQSAQCF